LLDACRNYPGLTNARRITFEYVMLKGVNDSMADAKALVKCSRAFRPRSISFRQSLAGIEIECSDWEQIEQFPNTSSMPATPRRCARRAGAISSPLRSAQEPDRKLSARERMALRAMAMTD